MNLLKKTAAALGAASLLAAGLAVAANSAASAATVSCGGNLTHLNTAGKQIMRRYIDPSVPKADPAFVDHTLKFTPVLQTAYTQGDYFATSSDGRLHHIHTNLSTGAKVDRLVGGYGWDTFSQLFTGFNTLYGVTKTGALRAYTVSNYQTDRLTVTSGREVSPRGWSSLGALSYEHSASSAAPAGYAQSDAFVVPNRSTGELIRYYINDGGTEVGGKKGFVRQVIRASSWQNMKTVIPVDCYSTSTGSLVPLRYYLGVNTNGSIYRYSSNGLATSTRTITSHGAWLSGYAVPFVSASH